MGANFHNLKSNSLTDSYDALIEKSKESLGLCWVGPPVNLDYVSKLTSKAIFWTHRFHLNFSQVKMQISGGGGYGKSLIGNSTFFHQGKKWHVFHGNFNIRNFNKCSDWEKRRHNFGSFCRENLIDTSQHWENVKIVLSANQKLIYNYTGRAEIHTKWCKKFNINMDRVIFRGWLAQPESKILDMAFILDGNTMGHGLMGMEAIAGRVPIIRPSDSPGFYKNFIDSTEFGDLDALALQKVGWTSFHNDKELRSISNSLLNHKLNTDIGSRLSENLHKKNQNSSQKFNTFINLVKNENL